MNPLMHKQIFYFIEPSLDQLLLRTIDVETELAFMSVLFRPICT